MLHRPSLSLRSKFVGLLISAAVVPILAVAFASVSIITQRVQSELSQTVERSAVLVRTLLEDWRRDLVALARILAEDSRFQADLSLGASARVEESIREKRGAGGTASIVVLDPEGRLVAQAGSSYPPGAALSGASMVERAREKETAASGLSLEQGQVLIEAAMPIRLRDGSLVGFVELQRSMDAALLSNLKRISGGDISLILGSSLRLTTLPPPLAAELRAAIRSGILESRFVESAVTKTLPLEDPQGTVLGSLTISLSKDPTSQAQALLTRRVTEISLVALLGSVLLGLGFARGIRRPIRVLVEATRRVAKGDLTGRIGLRSPDEIGELAYAFDMMRADLATALEKDKKLAAKAARAEAEKLRAEELAGTYEELRSVNEKVREVNEDLRKEVAERRKVQGDLLERVRLSQFEAKIAIALTADEALAEILRRSCEAMVRHLGAAFARIWTLNEKENVLELQASAGLYTHLNGAHSRVGVGQLKIGRIAEERKPHLTNSVLTDARIGDPEWARRERMVAFAGYPLLVGDRLVGVVAMFARSRLSAAILDSLGLVANHIAIGIERTRAEAAHKRLEDELRHSQKLEAVGRLAGGIAHDFNNLLTVIQGTIGFLFQETDGNSSDQVREDLQAIEDAASRASDLTRQLLTFARRQIVVPRLLNPNATVRELNQMLRRLIHSNIEVHLKLDPDLWSVKIDPGQLEQVLMNLAVNAQDAMPNGGALTIETANASVRHGEAAEAGGLPPGEYVRLTIRDTGCGISEEVKAKIFEPFFTTKERGQGTGLGLSTCYGIVTQSGGQISVESEPGRGAAFAIHLPRVDGEEAADDQALGTTVLPKGTERILVVEDEPRVRSVAVRMLRQQGYTVLEAGSGAEALEILNQDPAGIQLLLTDVMMPGMPGYEVARTLRERIPSLKVLLMSGHADVAAAVREELERREVAFIEKPLRRESLLRRVRELLDAPGD